MRAVKTLALDVVTVLFEEFEDTVGGVKKLAEGFFVVESVDNVGDVLGHIDLTVPGTGLELGHTVDKVGGEDLFNETLLVGFVEDLESFNKETEGDANEDAAGFSLFELLCNVDDGVAGGDHVVDDDHILALDVAAEELVGDDGVTAVDNNGVVTALIEHAKVDGEEVGIVKATGLMDKCKPNMVTL